MTKKIIAIYIILGLLLTVMPVLAEPDLDANKKSREDKVVRIPLKAVKIDDDVFSLGQEFDPKSGQLVEGYAIIHRKDKQVKSGNAKNAARIQCYKFLASGARWKVVEPWLVNPLNSRGLTDSFVFSNLSTDMVKWEDAADGVVNNSQGVNILGDGILTSDSLVADTNAPDGQNEVYFADVDSPGAIAITIVWGIFSGPTKQRRLVEWDQIYDDSDFDWSMTGELNKMDFENIATHELGHSVGMADLYTSSCSEETMYGYAGYGETKKRDLNKGDIVGVSALY